MTDREKVVKGLECCRYSLKSHCDECPYIYEGLCSTNDCTADLASEAFAMLKEQEAKPVVVTTNAYGTKFYHCPKCNRDFYDYPRQRYCSQCGQKVIWE